MPLVLSGPPFFFLGGFFCVLATPPFFLSALEITSPNRNHSPSRLYLGFLRTSSARDFTPPPQSKPFSCSPLGPTPFCSLTKCSPPKDFRTPSPVKMGTPSSPKNAGASSFPPPPFPLLGFLFFLPNVFSQIQRTFPSHQTHLPPFPRVFSVPTTTSPLLPSSHASPFLRLRPH